VSLTGKREEHLFNDSTPMMIRIRTDLYQQLEVAEKEQGGISIDLLLETSGERMASSIFI